MAESIYKRLTRSRPRRKWIFASLGAQRQSLWLGPDHLLSINSSSYSERYKRFYFADIQAFFIFPSPRRVIWNWMLAAILTMHLLVFLWIGSFGTVLAIVLVILAIPLTINNLLGPTCSVYLQTAVQVEELPSLSRVRRTNRVLERIRPLIATVQGSLSPEEAARLLKEETGPTPAPLFEIPSSPSSPSEGDSQ